MQTSNHLLSGLDKWNLIKLIASLVRELRIYISLIKIYPAIGMKMQMCCMERHEFVDWQQKQHGEEQTAWTFAIPPWLQKSKLFRTQFFSFKVTKKKSKWITWAQSYQCKYVPY